MSDAETNKQNFRISWFMQNMFAGFNAGLLTSLVTTPLDVLKTRIQNDSLKKFEITSKFKIL
jgi:hypothetical protein